VAFEGRLGIYSCGGSFGSRRVRRFEFPVSPIREPAAVW